MTGSQGHESIIYDGRFFFDQAPVLLCGCDALSHLHRGLNQENSHQKLISCSNTLLVCASGMGCA
jgi:hypothetical protein